MGQAHGKARLTDSHRFEDSAVKHLLIGVPGMWGLPKTRGPGVRFLGVPIKRILVFWIHIGVPLFGETTI